MKILIVGSQGNLGGQLKKVFKDEELVEADFKELDITDKEAVLAFVKGKQPQVIINAAAYNAVDKCEEDAAEFELAKKVNGLAPGYLALAAKEAGAVLVHYSTDYVFSGDKTEGYREEDEPGPINNYGKSKLLGEEEIQKHGSDYLIVRTSKLFGPPGENPGAKKSFIDIMLDLGKEKDELEVVDEERSCFTYTFDLARATQELLQAPQKYPEGIYHLVNEGPCTWYECAKRLFEIQGKTVKLKPVSGKDLKRPARRPANSQLLNTKGPQMRNWEEALRDYLI